MQREQSSAAPHLAAVSDLEVRFRSIAVSEIHDPGSNAEAEFTFKVNGQTQTFRDNDLGIGKTSINRRFVVRVPPASALNIVVSGTEHDVTSGDDPLPGFTRSFSAAQGFGVGIHSVRATNEHMTYLMDLEIRRLLGLFTTLTGTATLTTSDSRAPGPFTVPVTIGLFFNDARTQVSISSFPAITVQTDSGPVTVTGIGGANGTFNKAAGAVSLPVDLNFNLPAPASDSDLPITFTTGSAGTLTGVPLNRTTRKIRLVGIATFDGGTLNGEQGTLVIDGELADLP
ncbi:hypothetical protein AB0K68_36305 [Streptomyces sp. NPDC050698]